MASEVTKNEDTGDVEKVQLDEVITQGDPRWGLHNPEVGPHDTLSIHDEEVDTSAIQVDIPQKEPNPSDELYAVKPEDVPSQEPAEATPAKSDSSSSKSDSSSKS